jgi:hypothetical protein
MCHLLFHLCTESKDRRARHRLVGQGKGCCCLLFVINDGSLSFLVECDNDDNDDDDDCDNGITGAVADFGKRT